MVHLRTLSCVLPPHQVPAPDALFDYVMGDVLTTIVVELLVTPSQVRPKKPSCVHTAAAYLGDGYIKAWVMAIFKAWVMAILRPG